MKKICIVANEDKDKGFIYTRMLADLICEKGGEVSVLPDIAKKIGIKHHNEEVQGILKETEVIICLGGDGTFLKVARNTFISNIPILGINLGSLGFLTEVDKGDVENAVENLINDTFQIENRMMLETAITRGEQIIATDTALNDVVISRGALSRILHVKTYINDEFVDLFPGDGLIVSSPTGCTGYSLSAGGPIVEPDTHLIIVTPICPHLIYSRSFITLGDRSVKAVIDENYSHNAMVTVDGQKGYEICGGDVIEVKEAKHTIKLIRINSRNFFNVLRTKIYFRGESKR